jgi:hypothetical protein
MYMAPMYMLTAQIKRGKDGCLSFFQKKDGCLSIDIFMCPVSDEI